jgi:hypothetical protein
MAAFQQTVCANFIFLAFHQFAEDGDLNPNSPNGTGPYKKNGIFSNPYAEIT